MNKTKIIERTVVVILGIFILYAAFHIFNQSPENAVPTFEVKWPTAKEMQTPPNQSDYCKTNICKG